MELLKGFGVAIWIGLDWVQQHIAECTGSEELKRV